MAFSSVIDRLVPQGATFPGGRPNVIREDGSIVPEGVGDDSISGRLKKSLADIQIKAQEKTKKEQELLKEQSSMYQTLRDSGYDPKSAFDAVQRRKFPEEPGKKSDSEEESAAKQLKTQAETAKTEAETSKIQAETDKIKTKTLKKSEVEDRIVQKVADGEDLTPGEQKIYDEIIKRPDSSGGSLAEILENNKKVNEGKFNQPPPGRAKASKKAEPSDVGYVPMIDPSGKRKKVHREDVDKAIARGWKRG